MNEESRAISKEECRVAIAFQIENCSTILLLTLYCRF